MDWDICIVHEKNVFMNFFITNIFTIIQITNMNKQINYYYFKGICFDDWLVKWFVM